MRKRKSFGEALNPVQAPAPSVAASPAVPVTSRSTTRLQPVPRDAAPMTLQTAIAALDQSVTQFLQEQVKENKLSVQEYGKIAQAYIASKPTFTSWENLIEQLKELSEQHPVLSVFYTSTAHSFSDQIKPALLVNQLQPKEENYLAPLQQQEVAQAPQSFVMLGKSLETNLLVPLSQSARLQGLYIIGVNGTGKSTFISNLIAEDMKQGLGLCLLDPHGDLTNDVLSCVPDSRVEDVILLDLMDSSSPFGLNVFECPDPSNLEQVALTASFVMHVFEKVWDVGTHTPLLAQVLRNVTFTLIQNPGTTLAELPLLLQDEQVRGKLVSNVSNNQVKLFWNTYNKLRTADQLERTSSTLNKADAFLTQPIIANIVGQSRTTIDFRKIMDEGKILLVQLTPQLEDLSRLVGAVFIGQLLMAAMSRKDIAEGERTQFNLYADEYQRFATEDFATLLSEARKFRVATTIAHQYLDQLDEKNRGASVNAANLVVFRVSGQDAAELAKEFDATPEESLEFRTEPVRTTARDVIGSLIRKGHRDEELKFFADGILTECDLPNVLAASDTIWFKKKLDMIWVNFISGPD